MSNSSPIFKKECDKMEIKKLSDIDYSSPSIISFNATVIEILSEGDGDKRPFKINLKLEESGENVVVSSWKFENLDTLKRLALTDEVYCFEGQAGTFGNFGPQIRVGNIKNTGLRSSKKIIKTIDTSSMKSELQTVLNTYYQPGDIFNRLIKKLVIDNDKFWLWPAATKIHHAYPGGLAKHSLSVLRNSISLWNNYKGSNLDIKLLVAGSILHDIGKLTEYNQDGSRTIYGNLIPHPISGYDIVSKTASELGVDPTKDKNIVMLLHTILSHHEKLEFGSPVTPFIAEALIISKADALDAAYDGVDSVLDNLSINETSDRLIAIDGGKMFKWR